MKIELERKRQILLEEVRREEILRVAEALGREAIPFLLMKGSALAYTHYQEPWHRPRLDTDLLIHENDLERTLRTFQKLGFVRNDFGSSPLLRSQLVLERSDHQSYYRHPIDLHWTVLNTHFFRKLWSFEELWERSEAIPSLHPSIRGLGASDALLLAALHRIVHHFDDSSTIWLKDIDLVWSSMDVPTQIKTLNLAKQKKVSSLLVYSLKRALPPERVQSSLAIGEAKSVFSFEPSMIYLAPWRCFLQDLLLDLWMIQGIAAKKSYLREHFFPPQIVSGVDVLRDQQKSVYAKRIFRGFRRCFSRTAP